MPVPFENDAEVDVKTLLGGIVHDARELFVQQLTLFQLEIKHDVNRAATALAWLIGGAAIVLAGIVFLGLAAARLLFSILPALPLWGGLAIVGGVLTILGVMIVVWGMRSLTQLPALPDKSLEALKENIQWKTKN